MLARRKEISSPLSSKTIFPPFLTPSALRSLTGIVTCPLLVTVASTFIFLTLSAFLITCQDNMARVRHHRVPRRPPYPQPAEHPHLTQGDFLTGRDSWNDPRSIDKLC